MQGIAGSSAIIGPALYAAHLLVFVLGPPSLANVLVLRPVRGKWYVVGVICTIFAFGLILLQYCVSETLFGIQ